MPQYQNARHLSAILSENPVFHIVITGYDEKTGSAYFSNHNYHPRAWLVNKTYKQPVIRHLGAIEFRFYDYISHRNDWIYFNIAKKIVRAEGLDKS